MLHPKHDPDPALKIVTTVPGNAEAAMVVGNLEAAGIRAMQQSAMQSGRMGATVGASGACDIFVEEHDLDRAREVLNAEPISEDELIRAEEEAAATQGKAADHL